MSVSSPPADVLARIVARKREEVAARARARPLRELAGRAESCGPTRGFAAALAQVSAQGRVAVIAEMKQASPSRGVIREDFDPVVIAQRYAAAGAACLSVLTDERFFQGRDQHLVRARSACALPVLRKDFVIDPWQLFESRVLGADCVLLIAAILEDAQLAEFAQLAGELGMDTLLEVHDEAELERALTVREVLIGINNRDLRSFRTSLETTERLAPQVPPERLVVAESGIRDAADVARLRGAGARAFLVGETLMRAEDPGAALAGLLGDAPGG